MIVERYPWKQELAQKLKSIKTWSAKSHTTRGYFTIEKGIFLTAFIVRKLIENNKLTDTIRNRSIRCRGYKPFRRLSDRVSRFTGVYDLTKEYDLKSHHPITLSFFDLVSEIMHSYVFELEVDGASKLAAFYVNSYRNRDDRILRVELDDYLKAVDAVAKNDVTDAHIWKDPNSGRIHAELK